MTETNNWFTLQHVSLHPTYWSLLTLYVCEIRLLAVRQWSHKAVCSHTIKENRTLEVSGSFTSAKRALGSHSISGLVRLGVGVDALEESRISSRAGNGNTIPQSSLWPSHYRLNHLGSSAVLEELVVLLLSLMLIISSEAQWYVLVETGPFYSRSSISCSVRLSKRGWWKEISNWDLSSELYTLTWSVRCCSLGRSLIYIAWQQKARTKARDTTLWKGLLLIHYAVASRSLAYIITVDRRVTGPGMSERAPH